MTIPEAKPKVLAHSAKKGPGPKKKVKNFAPIDLNHPLLQKIKHLNNLANNSKHVENTKFRSSLLSCFFQCGFAREAFEKVGFVVGKKAWKSAKNSQEMKPGMTSGLTPNRGGRKGMKDVQI